ncbi:hypothetical protein Poli38472_001150 [Pythium oligandrum]|uniref:NADH:flavin oxidoreductase/NADH oxidase N-terminal domain-containing protein n=1 Tax=Pythium oligandrum TaxID=41045 RepID=A0A8K1CSY9_PYTOL|nr:hypothetical protein Poli38472_001150 [Pythium oligandrum]|eukprot:TMW68994.1 hypothetical protein Poli38472_001150 [Pythium oligandrum]
MSSSATTGYKLFEPLTLGKDLVLKNRIIFAPLTRARCDPATSAPGEMQEIYYEQRAGAGLIMAEATGISVEGLGWYGAPGLFTDDQLKGWSKVVERVHAKGGKIFLQLWHMGRQAHPSFNPKNECVAPSAIPVPSGRIRDKNGEHAPYAVPRALETDEVARVVEDFRKSAVLAKQAGFDGVGLHSANGYIIDQFLQSCSNQRTDKYGGSYENRSRFILEIVDALATVYPSDRIAVRLSPNGSYAGMGSEDNYEMFTYLMRQLSTRNIGFLEILDGEGFGYHDKGRLVTAFDTKTNFKGTTITNGSYTRDIAEGVIRSGAADAVCFGRPYISNPDLAERYQNDWQLNADAPYEMWWDPAKGTEGYIDYPAYKPEQAIP